MSTHLSRYFEEQRQVRELKPGQLARLAGCANPARGGAQIREFELEGRISQELFEKLAAVLEIDAETIEALIEQDRREFFDRWQAWVNEPIKPHVVQRLMAAVYRGVPLPDGIETMEEAEAWTSELAAHFRTRCCLVWSRKLSIWFDKKGAIEDRTEAEPGKPNVPYSKVGNKAINFNFDLSRTNPITWPTERTSRHY